MNIDEFHRHPLRIALFYGRGLISTAIRWQTRSSFSHAGLVVGSNILIEAWHRGGVRRRRVDDWSGIECFTVPGLSPEQRARAFEFAAMQVGNPYDFVAVLRFVSRRNVRLTERWFCSELVVAALAHAGVDLFRATHPWEVSPGMLSRSPLLEPAPAKTLR